MPKRIRCKFYDANGNPIRGGCRKTGFCDFVHPSDPGWDSAEPLRAHWQPRDNQNNAETWSNARQPNLSNALPGPRRGSNTSGTSSWNQYTAAEAGRPVDSGWGAGLKRKTLAWDEGGSSGTNASSNSSRGQGGGWDTGTSGKDSTHMRSRDNITSEGGWGDGGASWDLANNTSGVSVGWGPVAQDAEGSADSKRADIPWGGSGWGGGGWGAGASGWNPMAAVEWGAPATPNGVDNRKDAEMGDTEKEKSSSSNAASAWDVGVSTSSNTQRAYPGGANNKNATRAKRKESIPVVTSLAWDRPASMSSKIQGASSSGVGSASAWSSVSQPAASPWDVEPGPASSTSSTAMDWGVTVDPVPFGASTATWLNRDEDMQEEDSPDAGLSEPEKRHSPTRQSRRRSDATLALRDTTPRRTRSPRKLTTRQDYVEVLCRALHRYNEWKSAEDAVADTVRMQNSEYYRTKSLGDRATDILNQSKKDQEAKANAAKRKFEEYLEQLEAIPPSATLRNTMAYEEVSQEMEEIRATYNEAKAMLHVLRGQHPNPAEAGGVTPGDDGPNLASAASKLQDRLDALQDYFLELRESRKKTLEDRLDGVDVFRNVQAIQPSIPEAELERLREHNAVIQHEVEKQNEDLTALKREVQQLRRGATLVEALQAENEGLKTRQTQIEQSHAALTEQLQSCTAEIETLKTQVKALAERPPAQSASATAMDPNALVPLLEIMVRDRTRLEAKDALQTVTTSLQESLIKQQEDLCQTMWIELRPTLRLLDTIHNVMELSKHSNNPLSQLIPSLPHVERNES